MKKVYVLSEAGLKAIKKFELLELKAYQDVAGVWTIGYGSTYWPDGRTIKPTDTLKNEAEADTLLRHTVAHFVSAVNQLVMVPLNANQFDALTSFTFNEGTNALGTSTLLKKLNAGDYLGAANQFLFWNKVTLKGTKKKVTCEGLTKRRIMERRTFLTPIA